MHEEFFDCLQKWFGGSTSGTECFASPFNSALPLFFSAFPTPDVDGHFGSRGDFFHPSSKTDLLQSGWYELNPPFSPGIMSKMAKRIEELLIQNKGELDATFVVVIPTVQNDSNIRLSDERAKSKKKKRKHSHEEEPGGEKTNTANLMSTVHHAASRSFHQLINSPYCKRHIILPARDHGYIEGGQHLRPTKFKESQYSTSVIVLKSGGWMSFDDAELFEKEIREAFASRHAMEVKHRKESSSENKI